MTKGKLTDVVTRLSNMQQKANNLTHTQEEIIIDSIMMLNDIKLFAKHESDKENNNVKERLGGNR